PPVIDGTNRWVFLLILSKVLGIPPIARPVQGVDKWVAFNCATFSRRLEPAQLAYRHSQDSDSRGALESKWVVQKGWGVLFSIFIAKGTCAVG
ncbi:hypothetical protein GGR56DRAFT_618054, partial [Xylariaceae sp. FL0804]